MLGGLFGASAPSSKKASPPGRSSFCIDFLRFSPELFDFPRIFTIFFRISGFGIRVSGFGFRVSGFGSQISGFGFRVSGFGFRVLGFGFRVSGFGFRVSGHLLLHLGEHILRLSNLDRLRLHGLSHPAPRHLVYTGVYVYSIY